MPSQAKAPRTAFIAVDPFLSVFQKTCLKDLLAWLPKTTTILSLGRPSDAAAVETLPNKLVVFVPDGERAPERANLVNNPSALLEKTGPAIRELLEKANLKGAPDPAWIRAATAVLRADEAFVFASDSAQDDLPIYAIHAACARGIFTIAFGSDDLACGPRAPLAFPIVIRCPFAPEDNLVSAPTGRTQPPSPIASHPKEDDSQQRLF